MNKKVAVQVITGNPISFYAYMHNFFTKWYHLVDKLYNEKINYVIECINEKFKYISLDPTKYNDVLYNNQYPYQIKLEKLPIDKIKRFINYV